MRCRRSGSSAPHCLRRSRTGCADFREGLKDTGYVEGENLAIVYRFAENHDDWLPGLAADLVRRRVAVIAAAGAPPALAAQAASKAIPIVFLVSDDPVRLSLVTSLSRPGGNITGINILNSEVTTKRLELLRELVPNAVRIAVLVNPSDATLTAALGLQPRFWPRASRRRSSRRCR
jgi:putative ABC transport system substrate-binding protein